MKLASWNVNSLPVRLDQVLSWLATSETDVLSIQETKVPDERFPIEAFKEQGYHVVFSGQKSYNGVAIISRYPLTAVESWLPMDLEPQQRVLAATVEGIRIVNLYVPNGSSIGSDKYQYKLAWLSQLRSYLSQSLYQYPNLAVMGDFNIAPQDRDVHDPLVWQGSVLVSEAERKAFDALLALGLIDSYRKFNDDNEFSWWDYRAAAFRRNLGLRIDHILLSESLVLRCLESQIDRLPRKSDRPSDHAPVWVSLST